MPRSLSLRLKVIVAVTLVIVGIAVAVGFSLVRLQRFFLEQEAEKRARSLAASLAVSARDPLLMGDVLRLGSITQTLLEDRDLSYAFVVDHEGVIAYHTNTQHVGTPARDLVLEGSESLLEVSVPIVVEGADVGSAQIGLDRSFIGEALRVTAAGLLGRLALVSVAGLAVMLLLTEVHLRRIDRLGDAVTALREGDFRARAAVGGRDELAGLAAHFNDMVDELRAARSEIEKGVIETVSALASTIEAKDAYTHGHCRRVALGTRAVAEKLDLAPSTVREFELAGVLHDIGKIAVSTQVLSKPSALTAPEAEEMQRHSEIGARILGSVGFLTGVARLVRSHHEDWDGGGYPDGLAGEAIPLGARVLHVVDAYDAMISGRPYRESLAGEEAMRRLLEEREGQFDGALVDLFCDLVDDGTIAAIRRKVDGREAS